MLKVVVLVSGGGTNLQAIIDAVNAGTITNTEIVGVISNNKNAYALERAKNAGIASVCVSPKDFASRAEFNQELLKVVDDFEADLLVLAGFLVVIPEIMIEKYRNRIINKRICFFQMQYNVTDFVSQSKYFSCQSTACIRENYYIVIFFHYKAKIGIFTKWISQQFIS